jgi:hypothetical protein
MSTLIDCADTLNCATLSGSDNVNVAFQAGVPNKIVVSLSQSVVGLSNLEVTGTIKSKAMQLSNSGGYSYLEIGAPAGAYIDLKTPETDDYDLRIISDTTVGSGGYLLGKGGATLSLSGTSVGIGNTSPTERLTISSGSFDRVGIDVQDVTSSIYLGSNTTGGARLLEFDRSTGLFKFKGRPSSGVFADQLTITIDGNVGVGTTNPARPLQIGNESGQQIARIAGGSAGTSGGSAIYFGAGASDIFAIGHYSAIMGGTYNDAFTLFTAAKNTILNPAGGNVGIGTTSPLEKLEVANTTGFSTIRVTANTTTNTTDEAQLRLYSGLNSHTRLFHRENGTNFGIYHSNSAGAATKFRINDSGMSLMEGGGNVGIGTATPQSMLHIEANGYTNQIIRSAGAFAGSYILAQRSKGTLESKTALGINDYAGGLLFSGYDGTNFINLAGVYGIVNGTPGTNDMPGALAFSTTADGSSTITERMRIDNTGSVGIGTATPSTKLHVDGNITATGITFGSAGGTGTATGNILGDYEEGTWTPNISSTTNPNFNSTSSGKYIKIGKNVSLYGIISLVNTGSTSSGELSITGLPFSCESSTRNASFTSRCTALAGTYSGSLIGEVFNGTSRIDLYKANNLGHTFARVFDLTNSTTMTFSAYYISST